MRWISLILVAVLIVGFSVPTYAKRGFDHIGNFNFRVERAPTNISNDSDAATVDTTKASGEINTTIRNESEKNKNTIHINIEIWGLIKRIIWFLSHAF